MHLFSRLTSTPREEPVSTASAGNSASINPTTCQLGFLSILRENAGYVGGYLVTNIWGRPLEFRLSSAVQPTRVHQVLYGPTLQPYICADLIGKALVDKAAVNANLILTDTDLVLDLRRKVEVPVLWVAPSPPGEDAPVELAAQQVVPAGEGHGSIYCHPEYGSDMPGIQPLIDRLVASVDLAEPFLRIREAVAEARRLSSKG
jgi:hypothetical protein